MEHGGFNAFRKAVTTMTPDQVLQEVKTSGLRGRGGAGFPTGVKWSFLPNNIWPHYVVANADESEPGTFKDREIMESNPFQFLEGLMIASYAVQANLSYVYLRGEFWQVAHKLDERIADLETAGLLGENLFGTSYQPAPVHPPGRRGLYLRRGDRPAGIAGRQAGPAAPAPALPGGLRPVRQAHRDQQRGDPDQRAADHRARRQLVSHPWHRKKPRPQDLSAFPAASTSRAIMSCPWGPPSAS